jgi:phage shock protein A
MWDVVSLDEGATLDAVESPRLVVDACPHCHRRARLIERAVARPEKGLALPWAEKSPERRVLQCEKCRACFDLPAEGLPAWTEKPEEREKSLRLANLRARWTVCAQEVTRWRKRSELAIRAGDVTLAEEARRVAARYEGEGHTLRGEIERLGGALPAAPMRDGGEDKIDEELNALREKAAAKKASQETAAPGDKTDAAPVESQSGGSQPGDAQPEVKADAPKGTGDPVDDELAALKRKMSRKEPPAQTPPASTKPSPPASDDDEVAALKRKLKKN